MYFIKTKLLPLLIVLSFLTNSLYSQKTSHLNTIQYGSTNNGVSICLQSISDKKGNIYSTGTFYRTIDFDPSSGTFLLTSSRSSDAFISKHDRAGKLVWVKQIKGTNTSRGYSIVLDDSSNVYTTGYFQGNADFDPSSGTFMLYSRPTNQIDVYVSKLDSNGQFIWAKQMGGYGTDIGETITRGATGNLFIGGTFQGVADFDPSSSNLNLRSNGGRDGFICSLTSNGLLNWAKSFGGSRNDEVKSIVTSGSLVYSTGVFQDTVDFDTDTSKYIVTSQGRSDAFIHILDTSGAFQKVTTISGNGWNWGYGLALDNSDNILATGFFETTTSFGDSTKQITLSSKGRRDSYVSKYNKTGKLLWAKSFSGTNELMGMSVASDSLNNIYALGRFYGKADFDPDSSSSYYLNSTAPNVYITRLDSNGKFQYVSQFDGGQNESWSVEVNPFNEILTSGFFYDSTDFDPGTGIHKLIAKGKPNAFITLLSQCEFTDTNYSMIVCDSARSPSSKYVWNKSGIYNDTLVNSSGCDSIIIINLTINRSVRDTTISTSCDVFISPSGKIWPSTGIYYDTIPTTKGCDSLLVINLTIKNSVLDTLYLNGCDSIRSPSGSYLWTAKGVYQDTLTASNSCDSVLTVFVELGFTKFTNIQDTSCSEVTSPSGKYVWSATGVYYDTLPSATNCDSILKYNLIIPIGNVSVKDSSGFLVAMTPFNKFQWLECKEQLNPLNGENKRLYKYKKSGEFAVEATEYSCIDTSSCIETTLSGTLTFENSSIVRIYPNPTKGFLIIESDKTIHTVEILTLSGALIFDKLVNHNFIELNIDNISSQLILIKVSYENGEVESLKIDKQ